MDTHLPTITLSRYSTGDDGTFSTLYLRGDGEPEFVCAELPWRDNRPNESCIPAGTYKCAVVNSPRFGLAIGICDVPGRTHILFHAGNYAGDGGAGYETDSAGCILPGLTVGESKDCRRQRMVVGSRPATMGLMRRLFGANPYVGQRALLAIVDATGGLAGGNWAPEVADV